MHISSTSKFAHLFLGYSHDPQPVFRDLEPQAHNWPDGAVFAITVHREELVFQDHWPFPGQDSATEFVAEDGWPVGFPEDKKNGFFVDPKGYGEGFYRGLFHRGVPRSWTSWTSEEWQQFQQNYQSLRRKSTETKTQRRARAVAQAAIIGALKPLLPQSPLNE